MTPQRSPAGGLGGGGGGTPALHYLSGPYGDTTFTKVFVGGLAWETRSEGLRAHFEVYGDILEAVVITDRATGRSKGYGFVTFRDPESARMACMDPYPVIEGRRANCNLAILGRSGPAVPFVAPIRPVIPYNGGVAVPGGMYVQSPTYQQPPYNYSQAFVYPSYGPSTYGPEYLYQQLCRMHMVHMVDSSMFQYMVDPGQQAQQFTHMGSLANMYQVIMLIRLVMYQVMVFHCQIRMVMLQMLCAYQWFSNNFLQELHALSNSS
ncbi:uncharacterized protein LOC133927047 isoform X3 [Phragmites australis]|uniref:uncharacterized protein LOC133927047 isoform X3 n=1 Tax=Phragmites australis TaxID=29695 RepID=UPI002D79C29B|nr:uncharacterized protein LOC133927047 isoform X3 [Phragmites australis]